MNIYLINKLPLFASDLVKFFSMTSHNLLKLCLVTRRKLLQQSFCNIRSCSTLFTSYNKSKTIDRNLSFSSQTLLSLRSFEVLRQFHSSSILFKKEESSEENDDENKRSNNLTLMLFLSSAAFIAAAYSILFGNINKQPNAEQITQKKFLEEVLPTGEVKRIFTSRIISEHSLLVELQNGSTINKGSYLKVSNIKNLEQFETLLRATEKRLNIDPLDKIPIIENNFNFISNLTPILLIGVLIFLIVRLSRSSINNMMNDGNLQKMMDVMQTSTKTAVPTGIRFRDVAGCTEAKQEVMEFVHYLKHPEKYTKLGAKMPRGCLLTGPPGVGKTLLAKAVATEADVPFLSKAGSDFVEVIGGLGARRVRSLFSEARGLAPCIIYIDELDAVGAKRSNNENSQSGNAESDQTLNQLLVEMDGMLSDSQNVIVMASTNRVDMLDRALLRPGRFDRHIAIDLPSKPERKEIFERHLKDLKLLKPESVYSDRLSNLSPGMSGADIANICNEAAITAAREKDMYVDSKHFEQAFERVLAGSAKKTTSLSAEERNIVAIHESGHALVGWLLQHTDALVKVSIVPRAKSALGFTQTLPTERKLYTNKHLSDIMTMLLAGRAAENLVFGTVTQGAQDDLKKVTNMAYSQVKHLGLNSVVGNLSFPNDDEGYVRPYSDALANVMDHEVKKTVYNAHMRAHELLVNNKDKLTTLSEELLNREVLNYEDIAKLIGPPPFGNKAKVEDFDFGSFQTSTFS